MCGEMIPVWRIIGILSIWSMLQSIQASAEGAEKPYTAAQLAQVQANVVPRFIPKSENIVYINDASGARELWQLSPSTAPKQITVLNQRIDGRGLNASRDGSLVVFNVDSGGNERYDLYLYEPKVGSVTPLTQTPSISEEGCRFSPDGTLLAMEADPEIQFRPQIFTLDIQTGVRRQLTRGDIPAYLPTWSRDGNMIAAVRSGDFQNGDLLLIPLADSMVTVVKPPLGGAILRPLAFSPDSRLVLCLTENREGFSQLALVDVTTKEVRRIGPSQWDVQEAGWNATAGIVFTQNVGGRIGLYRMQVPESTPEEILPPSGVVSGLTVNEDGTRILFSREDGRQPQEIFLLDLSSKVLQQLTHSLPKGIDPRRLSSAEPFKVASFDGTAVEGFAYQPPKSFKKPFAAVNVVHGGPGGQWVDQFYPLTQALTQAGFLVLQTNYRGSTGYGKAFEDMNNKDWGGGDRRDIRIVTEHFIKNGLIDAKRVGITGGSYGGYMTLMALTKDPDFYAAGAEKYGMPDLVQDYEITKDRFELWYETEMGNPKADSVLFADRSPIHFLNQLQAPLIVFQGINDTNVPKAESDLVVETLKSMGRSVEYITYPEEGHGFTRRENILDWMQRTVNFFDAQLH